MMPEQRTWLLCSVSVMPENKLSLQQLTQLIGTVLLTRFSRNIWFISQFPGGNTRFARPADAHAAPFHSLYQWFSTFSLKGAKSRPTILLESFTKIFNTIPLARFVLQQNGVCYTKY